jgi:hypothetical protein
MMKKGQIAIFLILGAVLLLIVVLLFAVRTQGGTDVQAVSSYAQLDNIEQTMEVCLRQAATDVLYLVAQQGGYYAFDDEIYFKHNFSDIAYWKYSGENWTPSTTLVESEIVEGINAKVAPCLAVAEDQLAVELGQKPIIDAEIRMEDVFVRMTYPVRFVLDEQTQAKQVFDAVIQLPLGALLEDAREIGTYQECSGKNINVSALYFELPETEVDVYEAEHNVVVFELARATDTTDKEDYRLYMAYRLYEKPLPKNTAPILLNPHNWSGVAVGDVLVYDFQAEDREEDAFSFEISDWSLGELHPVTGQFRVEIKPGMEGMNYFDLYVIDEYGARSKSEMFIHVEGEE